MLQRKSSESWCCGSNPAVCSRGAGLWGPLGSFPHNSGYWQLPDRGRILNACLGLLRA